MAGSLASLIHFGHRPDELIAAVLSGRTEHGSGSYLDLWGGNTGVVFDLLEFTPQFGGGQNLVGHIGHDVAEMVAGQPGAALGRLFFRNGLPAGDQNDEQNRQKLPHGFRSIPSLFVGSTRG